MLTGTGLPLCHEYICRGGSCQEHRGIMFLMAIPVALCLRNSGSQTPDCWLKLDRNTHRPVDLFRNSIATPSLVASILNGKYNNALPLERQSKAYKSNGINLSTNTMANWVIKSSDAYLSLLYERLHVYCILSVC